MSFPSLLDCFSKFTTKDPGNQGDDEADDEDVSIENQRVVRGDADGDVVVLKELRKVYAASTGPKVAVKGLR